VCGQLVGFEVELSAVPDWQRWRASGLVIG